MTGTDAQQTLIIGVGNPMRGDDGVGLAVTAQLGDCGLPDWIQVIQHTGHGVHLIDLWNNKDKVILVDAVHSGGKPGTLYRLNVSENDFEQILPSHSSHSFGIAEAVGLAYAIHRLPQKLILFAVQGSNFDYSEQLSPEVATSVDTLVKQILTECNIQL